MLNRRLLLVLIVLLVGAGACNRSSKFQKDENYYQGDPASYYNRAQSPRPITERIESMGQPKKRLVVLDFWNDTPIQNNELGKFAADELKRLLFQTQRVIIPKDVKEEATTAQFIEGDKVRVAQLVAEGRKMGVSSLIIGRITKAVFRQKGDDVGVFRQKQSVVGVDVEMKLFDVQNGREILATGKGGEASSSAMVAFESESLESPEFRAELTKLALRKAVGMMVPDVLRSIEKMTWEGSIAKIAGGKIYINAGRASGLVSGDILKVMTMGDDVYDPASGSFLGRTQGQLKGTLEVVDFLGMDGAVGAIHTGGNFSEGDLVQLY